MEPLFTTPVAIALTVVGLLLLLLAYSCCKRGQCHPYGKRETSPQPSRPWRPQPDPPSPWSQPPASRLQYGTGPSNQQVPGHRPRPVPSVNPPVQPSPTEPSQNRSVVFEVKDEVHSQPVSLLKRSAVRKHLHPTCWQTF